MRANFSVEGQRNLLRQAVATLCLSEVEHMAALCFLDKRNMTQVSQAVYGSPHTLANGLRRVFSKLRDLSEVGKAAA